MKDTNCSEPGAAYWPNVRLRGYYVTPGKIANVLNTAVTNLTSSHLFTIVPATGSDLTLSYWPATTDVSKAADTATTSTVCAGTVEVIGGQVGGVVGPADCPAGTYNSTLLDDGCRVWCAAGDGAAAGLLAAALGSPCGAAAGLLAAALVSPCGAAGLLVAALGSSSCSPHTAPPCAPPCLQRRGHYLRGVGHRPHVLRGGPVPAVPGPDGVPGVQHHQPTHDV